MNSLAASPFAKCLAFSLPLVAPFPRSPLIASSLAAFAFHGHLLSPAPSRHKKAIAMMERNREPATQKEHSAHRHVGLRYNIGESLRWEVTNTVYG